MKKSLARISVGFVIVAALLLVNPISKSKPEAFARSASASPHCQSIGGTVMTNLGVVDQSTTLGVVDGT